VTEDSNICSVIRSILRVVQVLELTFWKICAAKLEMSDEPWRVLQRCQQPRFWDPKRAYSVEATQKLNWNIQGYIWSVQRLKAGHQLRLRTIRPGLELSALVRVEKFVYPEQLERSFELVRRPDVISRYANAVE